MWYNPPDSVERERFHQGFSSRAYEYMGAHPVMQDGELYWHFSVWAPNAKRVSLTGEFCGWTRESYPMNKQFDGIWELRLPAVLFSVDSCPEKYNYPNAAKKLTNYKYAIQCTDGAWRLRADPYAFLSELRPNNASRLYHQDYTWNDEEWMRAREKWNPYQSPINIYEMHVGTWRRKENGEMLSYEELIDELLPYLETMGYTHVELLPIMEHPLDASWGYQVSGYYAPTARFGNPEGLKLLIDRLHQAGIGVILDWVPAHFPRDEIGLRRFDGTPCYEHADTRRSEIQQWGTMLFDYGRGEVCSFLMSNALYWLREYHADGLRCDAVSCMLYHDFCREEGQWLPNRYGGRENLEAIDFIRRLNERAYCDCPGIMMIAEESTAYDGVTRPVDMGGLGFGFKWNMGWMNDILSYVKLDPIYRKYHHGELMFSLCYAFSENYILPFSHDEVVHGKYSMLDKQPGDLWKKFAGLRALYGYTMAHPGKKLLFMGGEFGQFVEWRDDAQLDWFLLVYERHPQMQKYVRELNWFYRKTPAMYRQERGWDGFQWLNSRDRDNSVIAFMRSASGCASIVCVVNFTPVHHGQYRIGLPYDCVLIEALNSDREEFAGSNRYNANPIRAEHTPHEDQPYSAMICVPPLSCVYFRVKEVQESW